MKKLVLRQNLTPAEATGLMDRMIEGRYTPAQAAGYLMALRMKGESKDEIAAFARAMRGHARTISPSAEPLVDTCGTGGDSSGTFNISTAAAFIAAGTGVRIAKHGNRSVSSSSGSVDVLEEMGVKMLEPEDVCRCIEMTGIGFMFAPLFHPAMKNVAPVRKELEMRTVFNILGPLANPAGASAQVLGVFDPELTETMAHVLSDLGTKRALVVHSEGMDEIGLGITKMSELKYGRVETTLFDASSVGIERWEVPKAGSKAESASIITELLRAKLGPARDIACLNAAAAIYVADKAESIREGLAMARLSIDSTAAWDKLLQVRRFV